MLAEKLLLDRGGTVKQYKKNRYIFIEGSMPFFYFQVLNGSVKMVSEHDNGKEFLQGIFSSGQSFGEPVLFIDKPYPASAIANEDCLLITIRKEEFIKILKEFPEVHLVFTAVLARRIYVKSLIARAISINAPESRVFAVLKILRDSYSGSEKQKYKIELSRRQIADMAGFRVETVIRTIKKLEKKDLLKINNGKIYL